MAVALTLLFWLLDFRTSQYFANELHRIRFFKKALGAPSANVPKRLVLIRASSATNLIFTAVLVAWVTVLIHFIKAT